MSVLSSRILCNGDLRRDKASRAGSLLDEVLCFRKRRWIESPVS